MLNFKQFKKEQEKELKKGKKGKQIAAKNILKKYKNLKKPKKTYLVYEEDLETINYDEPQEDLFEGESTLAAANKVLDFDEFKQEQERKLQQYNDQLMNDAETINYVNDINLEDVRDNKNLKITAKKISDKYRKLRKRKATVSVPKLHKITETFVPADKKNKKQVDKAALIAVKNISIKYKKIYGKKDFKKAKNAFEKLKLDPSSVTFAEEILDKKLLLKLNKSKYAADKNFFNLVNLLENDNVIFDTDSIKRTDYVEKREIGHSTLYSFDGPFQLFHADVGNLEFLGKNATFPQYVLVLADLFSSKIHTFPMRSRIQIRQRLEQFYKEVESKRKGKKMKLQVDQEFQQVRIKDLNKQNNAEMFSTSLRGGKAFAAEQKIRERRTRISKLNCQKRKISPKKIIEISTENMNIQPSKKYA